MQTEGHRLLRASGKQAEVVRATGRTAPTVFRWFNGGRPDIDSMLVLREKFGIPLEAWAKKKQRKAS